MITVRKWIDWQSCVVPILAALSVIIASSAMVSAANRPGGNTILIAYQGAPAIAPENTFAGFSKAVELGANGLMANVRMTKDNRVVLMRDATIDRTTDGHGRLDQMLYDELQLYDAGSWRSERFKGERVPLLSDVLRFCKVNNLKLVLDVKQFGMEKRIVKLVRKAGMIESVYFRGTLKNIRELEPGLPIPNLIFTRTDEITRDTLAFAHAERSHIAVKMMNNDSRELLRKSINKGADIVITGYPRLIMDILHMDEPAKVASFDPVSHIDWQSAEPPAKTDRETQTEIEGHDGYAHGNTLYIRDEISTLVDTMQSKDSSRDDARMAALAITGLMDDGALSALTTLLEHKKNGVRRNAAWAIGMTSDKRGLAALETLLKEKDDVVRRESVLAIKRIAGAADLGSDETRQIVDELITVLRHDEVAAVRYDAARTLGDLKDRSAISQLADSLRNDPAWNVKSACAGALGKIGDKDGAPSLKKILMADAGMDGSWARERAAWALAEIGGKSVDSLIAAMSDNENVTKRRASWALVTIGRPSVAVLVAALRNSDSVTRQRAARALGWIGDAYAIKALKWALKDKDPDVRIASAWALGSIGDPGVLESLELARKDNKIAVKMNIIEAISRINKR